MTYPVEERFRLTNYTFDREYVVITTNVTESGMWETSVFCNDPVTDIRDFESLVDQAYFDKREQAKYIHADMLNKWNTIEFDPGYVDF